MLRAVTQARSAKRLTVGLRLASLGLRSALIVLLARYLSVDDVGLYGLMVVTISYAIYPLGLDFYTFSTRELVRSPRPLWPTFIRSQLALTALLYVALMPLLLTMFSVGLLPWSLAFWFVALVCLEHAGAEIDRILIAALDPLASSIGLFLRQGLMPLIVAPVIAIASSTRSIEIVLVVWTACNVAGVLVGALFLWRKLRGNGSGLMDWAWVRRGIRICIPFLIGTLCLRALFTFDRQVISIWGSTDSLASYTLFATIGMGLTSVVSAGVVQFVYPHLVAAASRHSIDDFKAHLRSMFVQTLLVAAGISLLAIVGLPVILLVVGNATYDAQSWIMPWIMLATSLYNISLVPHYVLYSLDGDRSILLVTVVALAVFAVTSAVAVPDEALKGVLAGLVGACTVLIVGKSWCARRLWVTTTESWKMEGGHGNVPV